MKLIRFVIGRIILLMDYITRPSPIVRSKEDQDRVNAAVSGLSLYQFNACPFCVKVRRHMWRQSLKIELRDVKNSNEIKCELVREGGKLKVPCLRIEVSKQEVIWMYSSDEICAFLDNKLHQLNII